jgi:DNA polymerase
MIVNKEKLLCELRNQIGDCNRCKLHTTRNNIVFGEGNPDSKIIFIGEGPGKAEDLQGRPFVGRAGNLLTAMIENGMQLTRNNVYIANVVKCRPTVDLKFLKDRPPDKEETGACSSFLLKQIEIIEPNVIITLGNPSTRFLLNIKHGITRIRGTWFEFMGIPVMPTYHPSYVLRNGGDASPLKKDVWEDIKKVLERINQPENKKNNTLLDKTIQTKQKDAGLWEHNDIQGRLF